MSIVGRLHAHLVFPRRVRVLAGHIAPLLPREASVLDVGCGDGLLGRSILNRRNDLSITGVDILVRTETHLPVQHFDGFTLPLGDHRSTSCSSSMCCTTPTIRCDCSSRPAPVPRQAIVIKDHMQAGWLDRQTLRLMDWTGNAAHGVALPYNYWSAQEWTLAMQRIGAAVESWNTELGLYPWPASAFFDRSLHFVARIGAGSALRPS